MSGPQHTNSAQQIEQQAAIWIDRKDRAGWGEADQAQLDAWLAQSLAHSIAFWRLNAAWRRTERLGAIKPPPHRKRGLFETEWLTRVLVRTAAALAIGAVVAGGAAYFRSAPQQRYATPVGGREILSLADGSQIELNTATALRMSSKPGERKVWLDTGEAFFEIKHDAARPFIVDVAGHRITDLGTKFSIRTDKTGTEVALVEGRAQIEATGAKGGGRRVILKPGDVALATASGISVMQKSQRSLETDLAWRKGLLIFSNTTLAEAASQFNRYSQRQLVVQQSVADRRIDGTFPANNAAGFAAIVEHILHLRAKDTGNEIIISR